MSNVISTPEQRIQQSETDIEIAGFSLQSYHPRIINLMILQSQPRPDYRKDPAGKLVTAAETTIAFWGSSISKMSVLEVSHRITR